MDFEVNELNGFPKVVRTRKIRVETQSAIDAINSTQSEFLELKYAEIKKANNANVNLKLAKKKGLVDFERALRSKTSIIIQKKKA